jgi:hypothetical protein
MKHSNLTYRDKILKWFDIHPNKINSLCEDNQHILDWIYGGYTGKTSAKVDLTSKLVNRNADLGLVKTETFKKILETFVSITGTQEQSATFVFQSLIKQKDQLKKVKTDFSFLNQLILSDLQWETPNRELRNKILYSDIVVHSSLLTNDDEHKINYSSHPILFLLQNYFFYLHEVRNHDTFTFLKIDTIHSLNEHILLSELPVEFTKPIQESMDFLSIEDQDGIVNILEKIKQLKETKVNNFNNPILLPTIQAIGDTIKRDFYRSLKGELYVNQYKEHKLKL